MTPRNLGNVWAVIYTIREAKGKKQGVPYWLSSNKEPREAAHRNQDLGSGTLLHQPAPGGPQQLGFT